MSVPFQKNLQLTWNPNAWNGESFDLVIPNGKRFVIHQMSGFAYMPTGVKLTSVEIDTSVGPNNVDSNKGYVIALPQFAGQQRRTWHQTRGGWFFPRVEEVIIMDDMFIFSQHVLAFAEGPEPTRITAWRSGSIPEMAEEEWQGRIVITVAGYLVDVDLPPTVV